MQASRYPLRGAETRSSDRMCAVSFTFLEGQWSLSLGVGAMAVKFCNKSNFCSAAEQKEIAGFSATDGTADRIGKPSGKHRGAAYTTSCLPRSLLCHCRLSL